MRASAHPRTDLDQFETDTAGPQDASGGKPGSTRADNDNVGIDGFRRPQDMRHRDQ
jgi:hypothetical protein